VLRVCGEVAGDWFMESKKNSQDWRLQCVMARADHKRFLIGSDV